MKENSYHISLEEILKAQVEAVHNAEKKKTIAKEKKRKRKQEQRDISNSSLSQIIEDDPKTDGHVK